MLTRGGSVILFLCACGSAMILSGCIFPNEKVSIDIYGPDQINPNVTNPKGLRIRTDNNVQEDFNDMLVTITVPENIIFSGYVSGRPLNKTVEVEAGRILWVYRFTASLAAGATSEYPFSYTANIYEADFKGKDEYSFDIRVMVRDAGGVSLGNVTATWRVTRPY